MTWKFPKRIPRAGQVVSAEDFNDGIQPIVEEDGRFNEHNWNDDLKTQLNRSDMADDVSFRVLHKSNTLDASEGGNPSAVTPWEFFPAKTWQPIKMDGTNTSYSFTSRGGLLEIEAGLQYSAKGDPRGDLVTTDERFDLLHTLFGIRIDGALEPVSVVGDQDSLNAAVNMETGISGFMQGVNLDISVPVGPGPHTVEIVALVEAVETEKDDISIYIYSTEMWVWEIR